MYRSKVDKLVWQNFGTVLTGAEINIYTQVMVVTKLLANWNISQTLNNVNLITNSGQGWSRPVFTNVAATQTHIFFVYDIIKISNK
jgi:hypothetical protein